MANHLRQQIRERVATDLTGLSTTGSNVFQSRVYPLETGNLPGLLIYSKDEDSEYVTIGAIRGVLNRLSVQIEAYCEGTANFDDTIDTISKEVQIALAGDQNLNGLAKDIYLVSTEITLDPSGDKPIGYASIIYIAEYLFNEDAPDVAT